MLYICDTQVAPMKAKVNKITITLVLGEILTLDVDAVVNATDTMLTLPPIIIEHAGAQVVEACQRIGWCDVGAAVLTSGGNLSQPWLIHTAGPRWGEGSERGKLARTVRSVLQLAEEHDITSVALPPISTGTLGYPLENCATTILSEIIDYTFEPLHHLRTITICLDTDLAFGIFETEFKRQLDDLRANGEGRVKV